jgi:uncharacterized protein
MTDQIPVSDLTSDDKLWALLTWILAPIVSVIILLMEDKKSRPFLKYNAMVSLVWSIAYIIVFSIIGALTLGIGSCLMIIPVGFSIYWGVKSYQGETVKVPVITDFVKNQGWA